MTTRDERIDEALDSLHGPRDAFREILEDRDAILERICMNAEREAREKGVPVWAIIHNWTGHGSGVSAAIYHVYRHQSQ